MTKIEEVVKELRDNLNAIKVSGEKIAEESGVGRNTVYAFKQNKADGISLNNLVAMAQWVNKRS